MEREQLKGKQTLGKAKAWSGEYGDGVGVHTPNKTTVSAVCSDPITLKAENQSNAALYAEAHNVANETGMWPLDMVERIRELEEQVRRKDSEIEELVNRD